jgi:hypothetical protein
MGKGDETHVGRAFPVSANRGLRKLGAGEQARDAVQAARAHVGNDAGASGDAQENPADPRGGLGLAKFDNQSSRRWRRTARGSAIPP